MQRRRIEGYGPNREPAMEVNPVNRWNRGPGVFTGDGLRPEWREWIGDALICYNEDRYAMSEPAYARNVSPYI